MSAALWTYTSGSRPDGTLLPGRNTSSSRSMKMETPRDSSSVSNSTALVIPARHYLKEGRIKPPKPRKPTYSYLVTVGVAHWVQGFRRDPNQKPPLDRVLLRAWPGRFEGLSGHLRIPIGRPRSLSGYHCHNLVCGTCRTPNHAEH